MTYTLYLLTGVFLLTALLQLNDPDPAYWVTVYAATAMVCLGAGLGRQTNFWCAVTIGGAAAGMIQSAPGFWRYLFSGDLRAIAGDMLVSNDVEAAREFLGLSLALCALLYARKISAQRALRIGSGR